MSLTYSRLLVPLVILLLSPRSSLAWEEDVHYLLTFWLANQAGMSRQDADIVAKGNQSYDDSNHSGAISTVTLILLTGDEGAARDVQRKHFANDALLPSPPLRRVVEPNSPAARKEVEAAIALPARPANAIFALGEALHSFQDSWSQFDR